MLRSSSRHDAARFVVGGAAAALAGAVALSAAAAPPKLETGNAALRRACATGALTAYACARRGITTGAPVATPPPVAGSGAAPDAETTAATPSTPAVSPPSPSAAQIPPAALAARSKQAEPARSVRPFRDARGRYDFEIPDGWTLALRGGLTTFTHGDAWMQLRSTASMPVGGDAAVQLLRGEYENLQQNDDGAISLGGRAGRRQTLTARSKGGRPSALVVVTTALSPADEFVLIAGAEPQYAGDIEAGVAEVARTLHFR